MAYPTGAEIVAALPAGVRSYVTDVEAQGHVDEYIGRIADASGATDASTQAPETATTRAIVNEGAYGKALRRALLEAGQMDTTAAETMIRRAESLLASYDASSSTPEESEIERPAAYVEEWSSWG